MSLEFNGEEQKEMEYVNLDGVKFSTNIDPAKLMKGGLYLYDEPDRTFEKYGHLTRRMVGLNAKEIMDFIPKVRYLTTDGKFRKLLIGDQPYYPHEEVAHQIQKLFEKELDGAGMKIVSIRNTHDGFTQYWECLSDKFNHTIKDSYQKDDIVSIGMMVRNGIGTNVALGIDLYTNRLVCTNGAIARGRDIGSISLAHTGKFETLKQRFIEAIPVAIQGAQELIQAYQKSVYIKMTQKIAEKFYNNLQVHLAPSHFPEYFGIDLDQRKDHNVRRNAAKVVNFKKKDGLTVWETFNDFTKDLWHADKIKFSGIRNNEIGLHKALLQVVQ